MAIFKGIFGDASTAFIGKARQIVRKINDLEEGIKGLSDEELRNQTAVFKDRLKEGQTLDDILPEAYATVREVARRTLGQRHYDVQLIGGIAMHKGNIAEMRTGEGKTLVATLPVYLNALTGKGVHVVTVNDYLSRRDGVWMGQIYSFLGLSVSIINSQNISYMYDPEHKELDEERDETGSFHVVEEFLRPITRKEAYEADITYGTNNEYGFDYLRDNLASQKQGLVQRDPYFAIVDEIDSILIDEARTPLIISTEAEEGDEFYKKFASVAAQLTPEADYTKDEKRKAISLTDDGISKAEKLLGISNIYTEKGIKYVHHLETAVRARALFLNDKDYVVRDGEVVIVDPFTGRMQPGRRWNEGLHQAIEAKEGVSIQKESRTAASITFQNYFKFYEKLAGMTGTAETSKEEFRKVYGLDVVVIPTHRPIQRIDQNDLIFQTEKGKWKAIARLVKEKNEKGQPVLIGTISVERSELLSAYLREVGVTHTVLNAKNHEKEGELIAQAGKRGAVTVATNMAGRGIDIALGGSPLEEKAYEEIKSLGGLFVLGTERHEARRIDNQLRGRAGRQGDPGETQFFVSLEDDLMRVFGSDRMKNMMGRFGIPEDEPIKNKLITRALEKAQKKIEGFHFDARKHTLEYDDVLSHQRNIVYGRRRTMVKAEKEDVEQYLTEFIAGDADLENKMMAKRKEVGEEVFLETFRRIVLYVTDMLWRDHLETMDHLRSSVNLRAYGGREPLVEYQKEGLRMFRDMENAFRAQVIELVETMVPQESVAPESQPEENLTTNKEASPEFDKVGRNDPCPCGSGKKYKKCHGK